jgi:DNA-binding IclR family transcriptional regulator
LAISRSSDRYNIRVVDRAVSVLELLADGKPRTMTELSKELTINSSTTFRLLATLRYHNLVQLDETTGHYRLGLACLELSKAYHTGDEVRQAALPVMRALRDETMETVHLGVLDQFEIVYLEKLEGLHAIGLMSSRIGRRAPVYCTGLGKVLLAYSNPGDIQANIEQLHLKKYTDTTITSEKKLFKHLAGIQDNGYALDQGEHEKEVRCVAAPIFNLYGKIVAAISVSGPSGRIDPIDQNKELIEKTLTAADEISKRLGHRKEFKE